MFVAIATDDYENLAQNENAEDYYDFTTCTAHPIFLAGSKDEAVSFITNYYRLCFDADGGIPEYVISETCGDLYVKGAYKMSVTIE